jgi:hypothetical protein
MDNFEEIDIEKKRYVNLSQQRTSAYMIGDRPRMEMIDEEIRVILEKISNLEAKIIQNQ